MMYRSLLKIFTLLTY